MSFFINYNISLHLFSCIHFSFSSSFFYRGRRLHFFTTDDETLSTRGRWLVVVVTCTSGHPQGRNLFCCRCRPPEATFGKPKPLTGQPQSRWERSTIGNKTTSVVVLSRELLLISTSPSNPLHQLHVSTHTIVVSDRC